MYDEYQVQQAVNGYLKDIKRRFSDMIQETNLTEEQQEEVKQLLGYACNHSKDDLTVKDAFEMSQRNNL